MPTYNVETWYTHEQLVDVSCLLQLDCCLYIPLFLHFSLQFSNIKNFCCMFFLQELRPTKLNLGTQVDSGWIYHVYHNQAAAAYWSLYFIIFLSNFQTLKTFVIFLGASFSGTVRPTKLKLGTHMNNGWMYRVIFLSNCQKFSSQLSQEL